MDMIIRRPIPGIIAPTGFVASGAANFQRMIESAFRPAPAAGGHERVQLSQKSIGPRYGTPAVEVPFVEGAKAVNFRQQHGSAEPGAQLRGEGADRTTIGDVGKHDATRRRVGKELSRLNFRGVYPPT